ncbi:MAG: hypothetical protein IPK26_15360 [Planctomycetes bacterium]|nr:hypothetical protein [Planctomycetota bacterium]
MRPWITAAALGAAQAAAVAALAFWLHPMEIANSEMDAYVVHVQAVLDGTPIFDGYHPVNTGMLGAAVAWLSGLDPFSALRVLGGLAAGAIVAGTFVLSRQFVGGVWPWLAALLMVANNPMVINGMQAASDMPATAVGVWTMVAAVAAARSRHWRPAFGVGLLFGIGVGTRFAAAGLAPLLLAVGIGGLRWSRACAGGIGIGLGFLPQALVAWSTRGSPLANDNWKNIALKQGNFDPMRLSDPGAASVGELLDRHGAHLLQLGWGDLWQLFRGGLGQHLLGGGPTWAAAATVALVGVAIVVWSCRGRAEARIVVAASLSYLVMVCWTFAPLERLLLPVLPIMAVAMVAAAGSVRWRPAAMVTGLAVVAIAGTAMARLPERLRQFVDEHPHVEVEVCRQQVQRPDLVAVASTFAPMSRYVRGPIEFLMPSNPSVWHDEPRMVLLAIAGAREVGANLLVVGSRSSRRWHQVLRCGELPAGVIRERADDDVVVLVLPTTVLEGTAAASWLRAFTATPAHWRDGPLEVRWRLPEGVDAARVARARVHLQAPVPVGPLPTIPLRPVAAEGLGYRLTFRPPAGTWGLQGRLTLDDGTQVHGPQVAVVVQ